MPAQVKNRHRRAALLVAIAGLALGCPLAGLEGRAQAQGTAAAKGTADPLPIKRITLYRSGVGYFERNGSVSSGTDVQLRFKTDQINDILKSMIVLVKPEAGRLDSVSYGSKEPLDRRLASFGVNIAGNPSIPQLLDQIRGAPIVIKTTEGEVRGTVLGVERRTIAPAPDQPAYEAAHVNVVTETGLRSIAIDRVLSFDILDKSLADELAKALSALAEYRADTTKTVDLRFSGGPSVPVTLAYIHEMPVWKTSYRLVLPEESASDAAGKSSQVQGWAIVENTTDEDWNQVRLGLVSGRPVSFQMDLYEPLFTYRPLVAVPTIPGVAPRAYAGGMDLALGQMVLKAPASAPASPPPPPPSPMAAANEPAGPGGVEGKSADRGGLRKSRGRPGAEKEAQLQDWDAEKGLRTEDATRAAAQATEVGEVFQYELEAPVTIERQRSAMIPILNTAMTGRRVSISSIDDGSDHPMRGVEITNSSDLQLLPGPISVYDGAAYAGDAQIGHVSPGDKRLLAYAVDLEVGVITKPDSSEVITGLKIVGGLFERTSKQRYTAVYAYQNNDEKRARTVVIEHHKHEGFSLVEPKAAEQTQDLYRFEAELAPGGKAVVSVVEERIDSQRIGLSTYGPETLAAMRAEGRVSEAVVAAIRQVADKQAGVARAEQEIVELDRQTAAVGADQDRIRENIRNIAQNSDLYSRYMQKLADQETQLESIARARADAQARLETLRTELESFVRGLNVN